MVIAEDIGYDAICNNELVFVEKELK